MITDTSKAIDKLIEQRALKQAELATLAAEIEQSSRSTAVVFVDLADSTSMKEDRPSEEWLGLVYEFIRRCDQLARKAGGTVVKRIGDEVMLTFESVDTSELFMRSLENDPILTKRRFKVAADYGTAYHFRFLDNLEDDPYGSVVDRCARIAKLTGPSVILCSEDYLGKVKDPSQYTSAGEFFLKGISEPCKLYFRSLNETDVTKYLEPLFSTVNSERNALSGYRSIGRKLTTDRVRDFDQEADVRPFLVRELLNIPRWPHAVDDLRRQYDDADDKDAFRQTVRGHLVEWDANFSKWNRQGSSIEVELQPMSGKGLILVSVTANFKEALTTIAKDRKVRVRGVITNLRSSVVWLNYADLQVYELE